LVDGENRAGETLAHLQLLTPVFFAAEFGDLRGEAGVLVLELLVDRFEFGHTRLHFGVVDVAHFRRALGRGGGGLLFEFGNARVLCFGVRLQLIDLGLDRRNLLLRRSKFLFRFAQIRAGFAELRV
jgi:hypothetical protein